MSTLLSVTDVQPRPNGTVRVAQLPPVIDVANAIDVSAGLIDMLTAGTTVLIGDMAATAALSLEGLQALLLARAAASRHGAQLRLASIRPHVRRYMELTEAQLLLPLYDSVEQARAATAGSSPEPPPA